MDPVAGTNRVAGQIPIAGPNPVAETNPVAGANPEADSEIPFLEGAVAVRRRTNLVTAPATWSCRATAFGADPMANETTTARVRMGSSSVGVRLL
jgi:hypothetical protein